MQPTRLIELEAIRGLAAVLVLVHHLLLAFFPRLHGLLFPDEPHALFGTPLFALINGSAAVVLFFVLSGFVLTVRALESNSIRPLVLGAMKRWPRLLVPVLLVNLVSGVIAGGGYYHNKPVSAAVGSPWLGWFFAEPPLGWETFLAAGREGALTTFFKGDAYFNSNLWTMFYEFYGSFIAFAVAALLILSKRRKNLSMITLVISASLSALISPYFMTFSAGVALAWFYSSSHWPKFREWTYRRRLPFWALVLGAIVLLAGYHEAYAPAANPLGLYAPLLPVFELFPLGFRVLLHTASATLILLSVLSVPSLARRLRGKAGAFLGRLSFPLYLVQIPVICLVGSHVFEFSAPMLEQVAARFVAFSAAGVVSVLTALPLMWIETKWLSRLAAWTAAASKQLSRLQTEVETVNRHTS